MLVYDPDIFTTTIQVLVCLAVIVIVAIAMSNKDNKKTLPPGPRRYPVLGNLSQLKGDEMFYVKLNEMRKTHGDVLYLQLGAVKMLVVFGHDKVKKVLQDQKDNFKYRPIWLVEIKTLDLTKGIVWSNGLQNDKIRTFALPAVFPGLGPVTLTQRVQIEAEMVVKALLTEKGDSSTLKKIFYNAICNINCGLIFGSRYEYADTEFQEFIGLMDQLLQRQGIKNPLNFFPVLQKLPDSKKTKESRCVISKVSEFIHTKIQTARETFNKENITSLVDLYLAQEGEENCVTEENICHIVRDFFVAGTENVAIGLVWLIGYMVTHTDVQEKCRQYILQTTEDNKTISMEDIEKVPYIEATVQEVLRLANIAPLSVPHAVHEEVEFEEFLIPKDTMVLTHLQSVHVDPTCWEDPDTFNPDRFIKDDKLDKKEAYMPYSIGSRYCLAAKLAQMELLITLSTLLKHFKFTDGPQTLIYTQPGAFVEPKTFCVKWTPVESDK
ncbi:cytochrome P450 2J4-like isoform X2 [Ruditapes philippinarum]|uniref:cytochrome P450 2J4-like isoform X2 n=1 Tax=Ruditapes philippinarum TaxID=129788 RepID=UPI00295B66CF|nr:cytochrome P450 2J4-like isoform X2 [Ruditapes philippinarum]